MQPFSLNPSTHSFKSVDEVADTILQMMSMFVNVNTLFIARNDRHTNEITHVLNKNQPLVVKGDTLPFEETLCKVSVDHGNEPLYINDLNDNNLTNELNVTRDLGGGSFIGIPIYYASGKNYGTICGLDTSNVEVTKEHLALFQTMASMLSFVISLDYANSQIQSLSVPFVPIAEGVAILPIIGIITEDRVNQINEAALIKSQELSLDYLIIDLSGVVEIDDFVSASLLKIATLLKMVGVVPVMTGMRPELALQAIQSGIHLKDVLIEANLQRALHQIGFSLKKHD
ncbi:STAS domain-containing protein [Jeotgalibacillus aurantiacus]|uniref:STAS domain-containing protein n=1 Tax=Jeotgalibacillus aurantiacus TaxID=2763266 RepID=UPI001D09A69F|nr:STAS domain-containing protein [Jeotgalibacillus aurantiacus]